MVILSNTWYVGEYDPTLKEPNEVFENSRYFLKELLLGHGQLFPAYIFVNMTTMFTT